MNNQSIFSDDFLNMMAIIGFAIGLYNLQLNEQSLSNDDVAKEVQINRSKLDEQNDIYLEKIIEQNNEILKILKGDNRG